MLMQLPVCEISLVMISWWSWWSRVRSCRRWRRL